MARGTILLEFESAALSEDEDVTGQMTAEPVAYLS